MESPLINPIHQKLSKNNTKNSPNFSKLINFDFLKNFGQNFSILNSSCMVDHLVSPLLIEGFPMVPRV